MDEDRLQQLITAIEENPEAWARVLNLDAGFGTYDDVNEIAKVLGDAIAGFPYDAEGLAAYLREGHDLLALFSESAQKNLNNAAGIGLKPMTTKPPNARIKALVEELNLIEPERIQEELANVVTPELLAMVDAIIKYNADFQKDAGLSPIIKRTWSGSYPSHDTKHTDWCRELAGEYKYGSEPKRIYARHKGCRCTVEYFPNAKAKGRITALSKGEVDVNGVLWNTRSDTLEQRLKKIKK